MISVDEIDKAILEHEAKDTTYANCERLAWLYIVRDHITHQSQKVVATLDPVGDSEFLQAVSGRKPESVWRIIDDLVESVKVLHPRMYTSFIDKIQNL